MLYVVYINW